MQIQSDSYITVPDGDMRFTHKLLDRLDSVSQDLTNILVPFDGLYKIEIGGGQYLDGFDIHLTVNGVLKDSYAMKNTGGMLYNFEASSTIRLCENDLIKLENLSSGSLGVDYIHHFTLTLKRLA